MEKDIHELLNTLRSLINNNISLYRSIDTAYESTIIKELKLIPPSILETVNVYIKFVEILFNGINFKYVSDEFKKLPILPAININVKDTILKNIKQNGNFTEIEKARISNILLKLKPLFDCADELLKNPYYYINKYLERENNNFL
jgi:hypothetical protein